MQQHPCFSQEAQNSNKASVRQHYHTRVTGQSSFTILEWRERSMLLFSQSFKVNGEKVSICLWSLRWMNQCIRIDFLGMEKSSKKKKIEEGWEGCVTESYIIRYKRTDSLLYELLLVLIHFRNTSLDTVSQVIHKVFSNWTKQANKQQKKMRPTTRKHI